MTEEKAAVELAPKDENKKKTDSKDSCQSSICGDDDIRISNPNRMVVI
ncbi:MAG: hypothetical protein ACFFEK_02230 [Candidatus Thorarchaeota archaeon]